MVKKLIFDSFGLTDVNHNLTGSPNKKAIEEVLRAKVIWPWVTPNDEEYSARAQELKKNGKAVELTFRY